jgi:hypothetical protein
MLNDLPVPTSALISKFKIIGRVPGTHVWRFFRAGGLDQVQLDQAVDLKNLDQLDQKLWVALSCPVTGLEFDSDTLRLIDTDKDGRIRVPEIVAAVKWAAGLLKDHAGFIAGAAELPLAVIDDSTPEGKTILASAKQILAHLDKPDATVISLAEVTDTAHIFSENRFNGDGIIPPAVASDDAIRAVINDIIASLGTVADRSGKPGIDQAKADAFFAELTAYAAWWKAAEDGSHDGQGVLCLGAATPAAAAAFVAVKNKITDYFQRCRLVAFDARAGAHVNRAEADLVTLSAKDLSTAGDEIAALPLARVEVGKALDLLNGLNPMWAARIAAFRAAVVVPLMGETTTVLNDSQWQALAARFAPYEGWIAGRAPTFADKLGIVRVREILALDAKARIDALIASDKGVAAEVGAIEAVERLVRYHRDLHTLLRNFINFADFYDPRKESIFQAGTLYLDQRSYDLCMRVTDPGAHAGLGNLGRIYIAYCTCSRPSGEKMTVAVAVTQGDADYLMVGRNGVFYDRKGRDWDATVIKVLEHPISIQQAFWSPYKKIGKMVADLAEQIAGAADKSVMDKTTAQIDATAKAAQAGKPPVEKPKIDMGMMAALGIVATGIASALGMVIGSIISIQPKWLIAFVPLGAIAALSGPAMIIAFIKLRQRTLGPLLEANGWAINGRVKINIPLGSAFTSIKELPANANVSFEDPFEDPRARRRRRFTIAIIVVILLIGGRYGYKKHWFDDVIHEAKVFMGLEQDVEPAKPADAAPTPAPAPAPAPVTK